MYIPVLADAAYRRVLSSALPPPSSLLPSVAVAIEKDQLSLAHKHQCFLPEPLLARLSPARVSPSLSSCAITTKSYVATGTGGD